MQFRRLCDPLMTCFEPEVLFPPQILSIVYIYIASKVLFKTLGNLIEGMDFHKFYFDHGLLPSRFQRIFHPNTWFGFVFSRSGAAQFISLRCHLVLAQTPDPHHFVNNSFFDSINMKKYTYFQLSGSTRMFIWWETRAPVSPTYVSHNT
jgi:hypothetical protein